MKLLRIICAISFLIGTVHTHSMGIFTHWFKKPYTSQVEYATDELKNLYIKSLKPYMDRLEYLGMQNPTANKPGRKPDLEIEYAQKIKDLVMQGANMNITESPLHFAIYTDNEDLIRFLLERGANPNQADQAGISAFNFAILQNNPGIVNVFMTTETIQPINPALTSHSHEAQVKGLLHQLKTTNLPGTPYTQEVQKKAAIEKMLSEPQKEKIP